MAPDGRRFTDCTDCLVRTVGSLACAHYARWLLVGAEGTALALSATRCTQRQPLYHAVGLNVRPAVVHGRRDARVVGYESGFRESGGSGNCPLAIVLCIRHSVLSARQTGGARPDAQGLMVKKLLSTQL